MRMRRIVPPTTALFVLLPLVAPAQPPNQPTTSTEISAACAMPPLLIVPPRHPLHVIGARETVFRTVFGDNDVLVVDGGTVKGLRVGQQYFVRRPAESPLGRARGLRRRAVHTAGWIRIVSASETTATASVDHACDSIRGGDYLDPFVAPEVPADIAPIDRSSEGDVETVGRVLFGDDERVVAGAGEFMLIDRGRDHGIAPRSRLAIYRDVRSRLTYDRRVDGVRQPLARVGEAVVLTASPSLAVIRIASSRDAVEAGDYVGIRK